MLLRLPVGKAERTTGEFPQAALPGSSGAAIPNRVAVVPQFEIAAFGRRGF